MQTFKSFRDSSTGWAPAFDNVHAEFLCPQVGEGLQNSYEFSVNVLLQFNWTKTVGEETTSGLIQKTGESTAYVFVLKNRRITVSAADSIWVTVNNVMTEDTGNIITGTAVPAEGISVSVKDLPGSARANPEQQSTNAQGIAVFELFVDPAAFAAATPAASKSSASPTDISDGTVSIGLTVEVDSKDTVTTTAKRSFGRVESVVGTVWMTQPFSPQPQLVSPGMPITPGVHIYGERQVSPYNTVYPSVSLSFGNGMGTTDFDLCDDNGGQVVVEIGNGSASILGKKPSTMDIWLNQLHYNAFYEPRRLVGAVVDTAAGAIAKGLTGGYGFIIGTTVGQIAKYGVHTLRDYWDQRPLSPNSAQWDAAQPQGLTPVAAAPPPSASQGSRHTIELLANGRLRVENRGQTLTLANTSGTSWLIPGGTSRTLDLIGSTTPGSAVTLAAPSGTLNAGLTLSPADGALLTTRCPTLQVSHPISGNDMVDPSGCQMWVNGRDVSASLQGNWSAHSYKVWPEAQLNEGLNTLEVRVVTLAGRVLSAQSKFTATGAPTMPTGLEALPGKAAISLRWTPNTENDLSAYKVARASSEAGPWIEIGQNPEPLWVDSEVSGGTACYRVAAKNGSTTGTWSAPACATKLASSTPTPSLPGGVSATNLNGRLELRFARPGPSTIGFRLGRGTSSQGPFSACLPQDRILGRTAFIDEAAQAGVPYYYQFTPVDRDGNAGTPSVQGPFTLAASAPPAPEAVSAVLSGNAALIRWNPSGFLGLTGYRIHKWTPETGWRVLNPSSVVTGTSYKDAMPRRSVRLYAVSSVNATGEGAPSQPVEVNSYAATGTVALPLVLLLAN
ncbi:hypothetical protein [Fundidesulfovibrio agrisoli]|uniref:hypothetical protein n=1 Tax=Fundidesulfovibrio agrisoli TaxID=2922717 RepID=UPI001FAB55AB|nr:hypothetical protein [Fundidesulfovibrio agrisoli]